MNPRPCHLSQTAILKMNVSGATTLSSENSPRPQACCIYPHTTPCLLRMIWKTACTPTPADMKNYFCLSAIFSCSTISFEHDRKPRILLQLHNSGYEAHRLALAVPIRIGTAPAPPGLLARNYAISQRKRVPSH